MAINARFIADFNSFYDAVQKAEAKLVSFQSGAGKVEGALNRMTSSFSGQKIIQEATLMAKVFEDAKGAAKFTQSELQRMGAVGAEAVEKMRALGLEIPPGIQKIAAEAKAASTSVGSMGKTVAGLASAIGIGFSVGAVVQFGKSVFDSAGKINDLASQLGVSTDAVQGFKFAAEQSGSSLDAVGTALTRMNANLSEGDKGTVNALKQAGLSFASIRNMKPEDAFLAIADGIQKIPDPMLQSEVALKLFGKSAAELLPAMKAGFRDAAESAAKMSEDTIKALDDAGDAWGRLSDRVVIFSGKLIATTMNVTSQVTKSWQSFALFAENAIKFGVGAAGAMADAQTQAERTGTTAKDIYIGTAGAVRQTKEQLDAAAASSKKWADALAAAFRKWSGADVAEQAKILDITFRRMADSGQITAKQLNDMAKEAAKLANEGAKLSPRLWAIVQATGQLDPKLDADAAAVARLGTEIKLALPSVDALGLALADLAAKTKDNKDGAPSLGFKLEPGFADTIQDLKDNIKKSADAAREARQSWVNDLNMMARAFDMMASTIGGDAGKIIGSIGSIVNALAQASSITMKSGAAGKGGILTPMFDKDASSSEKWAAGVAGGMQVASGAVEVWRASSAAGTKSAGALAGAMSGAKAGAAFGLVRAMSAGRREVKAFAEAMGGFDSLNKQLLDSLGKTGEELWIKLTQGVKKGDKAGAQKVIAEIQAALANAPNALAAAAGYQTKAELQAVADKAKTVYEYMVSSGKYTAESIADAFKKMQEAQDAAMGGSAKKQQEELDKITAKYAETISKLDAEYQSLSESVAKEAEEEVMGVVEAQERARMDQIKAEKAAQEAMRDAEIAAKKTTFDAWLQEGKKTYDDLTEVFGKELKIPYRYVPRNSPGIPDGGGSGYAPSLPGGGGMPYGFGSVGATATLDGKAVGKVLVKLIPGLLSGAGR